MERWGAGGLKRTGIMNSEIAAVVARMGHGDLLAIGDAGLPVPAGTKRIDLALEPGTPPFLQVVRVVLTELQVERALVARETQEHNPFVYAGLQEIFGREGLEFITHGELKELCARASAVIRTGECQPYANIILRAGVIF